MIYVEICKKLQKSQKKAIYADKFIVVKIFRQSNGTKSYISKLSNFFRFLLVKTNIIIYNIKVKRNRGMAQIGSALDWGSRGHGFKSRYSDHKQSKNKCEAMPRICIIKRAVNGYIIAMTRSVCKQNASQRVGSLFIHTSTLTI